MRKNLTTQEFIKKAIFIHVTKYSYSLTKYGANNKVNVEILCPIHGIFEQTPSNHLKGYGCKKCSGNVKYNTSEFIEKANIVHDNKYDYSLVDYYNAKTKIVIKCPIHGIFNQTPHSHLTRTGCPICRDSKGEQDIRKHLVFNKIEFIRQRTFLDCKDIRVLPFDFYLPDYNICIEYQGEQHYKYKPKFHKNEQEFLLQQKRDKIKIEYCEKNNILLLVIKHDENITNRLTNELCHIHIVK